MHGFGYWKNFSTLMEQSDGIGETGVTEFEDPAFEGTADVRVPSLSRGSDPFKSIVEAKSKPKSKPSDKASGSAGNTLKLQDADPQFGGIDCEVVEEFGLGGGLGGGIKKAMGKMESFHAGETVDDAGMDRANDATQHNTVNKMTNEKDIFKSMDELWKDIWHESYKSKVQNKNYDFDATKLQPKYSVNLSLGSPRTHITNPPMKRGW